MTGTVAVQPALMGGAEAQTCRLADDILLETEFARLGESYVPARHDLYLCPPGGAGLKRKRIVSEIYDVGPAEKRNGDASLEPPAGRIEEGSSFHSEVLWFGVPWVAGGEGIRAEPPQRSDFLGRGVADLRERTSAG